MSESSHIKIQFSLKRDADGYPPADYEYMWARPCGSGYVIDNIPFFIKLLAIGDVVAAITDFEGILCYKEHISYSRHNTLRVLVADPSMVPDLRAKIQELGCSSELSHIATLIAVDVPSGKLSKLRALLDAGEAEQLWQVEEACLFDD